MTPRSPVEIADKFSRKRAWIVACAAVVFALNVVGRMWMANRFDQTPGTRVDWWAINTGALLLVLATGGGLLIRRRVRAIMNDEVTRSHFSAGIVSGFWVAMVAAMAIYITPSFQDLSGRAAIRVVVSASVTVALLVFAVLEIRDFRDA
jgi:hypothetical protein